MSGMVKLIGMVAAQFGFGSAKKTMRKAAMKHLVEQGVVTPGIKGKAANALLNKIERGGFNAGEALKRRTHHYVRGSVRRGPGGFHTTGGKVYTGTTGRGAVGRSNLGRAYHSGQFSQGARNTMVMRADRVFGEASEMLKNARVFGAGEKLMAGIGGFSITSSMLVGASGLGERNIPYPEKELMQTQQMFMPRMAYTQRQRAIQAIHQSQMTTRSALGNEAMYMHG